MVPENMGLDPGTGGFAHASIDPFRPQDLLVPPGLISAPPACPEPAHATEAAVFLQHVNSNLAGDILLVCGGCGYETVYRVATGAFEPRPFRVYAAGFHPPRIGTASPGSASPVRQKRAIGTAKRLLSSKEAATQAGISLPTIRAALRTGRLTALKRDGVYRIRPEALAAYLAAREGV